MNGIILAGGQSSRFGSNKSFALINGRPLIGHLVELLGRVCRRTIIVTNAPEEYRQFGALLVADSYKNRGPLGGIHAGLLASDRQHNFVVACDMPLLNLQLIGALKKEADGFDLVVPKFGERLQMLHAFYSKNCLPFIEEQLMTGKLKLKDLLCGVNSKIIEYDCLGQSFMNINTQADYREALLLVN